MNNPSRSARRSTTVVAGLIVLALLFVLTGTGGSQEPVASPGPAAAPAAADADTSAPAATRAEGNTDIRLPLLPRWLRWIWKSEDEAKKQAGEDAAAFELAEATVAALALLIAFLTVAQLWQVPPPSTSLTDPARTAKAKEAASLAATGGAVTAAAATRMPSNLFDSNFSRTVLSGLGGLAVVSVADQLWDRAGLYAEPYYFILFVAFFLVGLAATAVLRGVGEALRSRITLSRPIAEWPPAGWRPLQWLRYWMRRFWHWVVSFRATLLVFLDTTFNVLIGKNQLQSAVFSETITDLHEGLLEAAERVRDEVHRAVIGALIQKDILPHNLPHEERIRVAVSLLSSGESEVYYIAWERGSFPKRFHRGSLAWLAAFTGQARWMKLDPSNAANQHWDKLYRENPKAIAIENGDNILPGYPRANLPLKDFYERRGDQDYEAFVVLPMPWTNRGWAGEHRRGAIHISFKEASYMDELWDNLEVGGRPNYKSWKGLLDDTGTQPSEPVPPEHSRQAGMPADKSPHALAQWALKGLRDTRQSLNSTSESLQKEYDTLVKAVDQLEKQTGRQEATESRLEQTSIVIKDTELCSVLHQALEVLGAALAHFDDEVYDVYIRARQHPSTARP